MSGLRHHRVGHSDYSANALQIEEFFGEAFRKKFYTSVEDLQKDLDKWGRYYNNDRLHWG